MSDPLALRVFPPVIEYKRYEPDTVYTTTLTIKASPRPFWPSWLSHRHI